MDQASKPVHLTTVSCTASCDVRVGRVTLSRNSLRVYLESSVTDFCKTHDLPSEVLERRVCEALLALAEKKLGLNRSQTDVTRLAGNVFIIDKLTAEGFTAKDLEQFTRE